MSLSSVLSKLDTLAATSSTSDKVKLLQTYANEPFFKDVVTRAVNPFAKFKVLNVQRVAWDTVELDTKDIFNYLDLMAERPAATDEMRMCLAQLASHDDATHEVVSRIVRKDLRCGVSLALVRRVWPEVPIHEVALCIDDQTAFWKAVGNGNAWWSMKLDGVRTWSVVQKSGGVEHLSRTGRPYKNFDKFNDELLAMSEVVHVNAGLEYPIIFDSEVISRDMDFQKQMTQVRRLEAADPSMFLMRPFDVVTAQHTFNQRYAHLRLASGSAGNTVRLLHHFPLQGPEHVDHLLNKALEQSFEGLVLKSGNHVYEFKRTNHWCKVKKFYTIDLLVKATQSGTGKFANTLGALIVDNNGVDVAVGSGYTAEERDEFWSNPPKMIEVKYQDVTKDGSLRFPTFVRVREDK